MKLFINLQVPNFNLWITS